MGIIRIMDREMQKDGRYSSVGKYIKSCLESEDCRMTELTSADSLVQESSKRKTSSGG